MRSDSKLLKKLITLGGGALQAEDALVRAFARSRGEDGGILRANNEHYYQFIIWRAASHVWNAKVEHENRCDLVLLDAKNECLAVAEMKRWMSPKGESELPGIRRDIQKLKHSLAPIDTLSYLQQTRRI